MAEISVMKLNDLPLGSKQCVKAGETEILLIHLETGIAAVEAECPHAGAKLIEGAVCNGRLVCPWHMATFDLPTGKLIEPPAMRPLKSYPVRIEGDRIFVDPDVVAPQAAVDKTDKRLFLIVGAGAAGAMAVSTLREQSFAGKIVVVDPNPDEPVDRTQISKDALGNKVPLDQIKLDIGNDFERVQASLIKLRSAENTAELSNGSVLHYDRALIATGGIPKRLEIPGADLAHTLRHPEDVRKILEAAPSVTNAVFIGTSFIALEAASALVQMGLDVTVAGPETRPFAKLFGSQAAQALMALHQQGGTHFRLGVQIEQITPRGVIVSKEGTEEELPSQLVIFGVGVEPALQFIHDLPTGPKGGGIAADSSLKAAASTWVAGDIANVDGGRIEHWRVAQQHGRISALGMLGEETSSNGVPFFWTYHFEKRLAYLGTSKEWDEIIIDGSLAEMSFLVFYISVQNAEQVVNAVLGCSRDQEIAKLAEPMRNRLTLAQARQAIR